MSKKHGPNKDNLEATRRKFLEVARQEFSRTGYYDASTAAIVAQSGMARGSLYYHFGDKKGLFGAVYEQLMEEMRHAVLERARSQEDPWQALIAGCLGALDLCTQAETRRIIVDVHTALTYAERLEILGRTLLEELLRLLHVNIAAGHFKGHEPRSLGVLVFGMISEGGRSFEIADDVPEAREQIGRAFTLFMEQARG